VCVDANAGARAAARQRKMEKDALFEQERLKFFNKETALERTQDRNVIGYSRDLSDAYVKALNVQGKGRKNIERAAAKYFASQKVNEGGRSRTFGQNAYKALLASRAEVDSIVDTTLRRNMAYFQEGARRKFMASQSTAREALGIPASYGAPVMLPPTNRLGGALQVLSSVAGIYSGFGGKGFLNFSKPQSILPTVYVA
tara:strand:+ start:5036 stop:5632 length:597 start_codon:yes stop_codon:yes gene_type:complete